MKLIKLALLSAVGLLSATTHATTLNTGWIDIVNIYTPVTGKPFITFTTGSMPECHNDSGAYLPIETGTDMGQKAYSALLAAQTSKTKVRIYYEPNGADPSTNSWSLCDIKAVSVN
jgi:hypothetical protein